MRPGIAARPGARALGEHQREMQEQRRQHQHRHHVAPVEDPIERVEPAAEREAPARRKRRCTARRSAASPDARAGAAGPTRRPAARRCRPPPARNTGCATRSESARPRPSASPATAAAAPCSRAGRRSSRAWNSFTRSPSLWIRPSVHRDQDVAGLHAGPGRRRAVGHDLRGDAFPLRPPEHAVFHLRPRRADGDVRDREAEQRDDDGGLRHQAQPGRTAAERVGEQ